MIWHIIYMCYTVEARYLHFKIAYSEIFAWNVVE